MAAAIAKLMTLTVRLGASQKAETEAVSQDEAINALFIGVERRLPRAIWLTYFPKSLFVVSQVWQRTELRA